jgi:hypothetical protein
LRRAAGSLHVLYQKRSVINDDIESQASCTS